MSYNFIDRLKRTCVFLSKSLVQAYESRQTCDNAEARATVVDRLWRAGSPPDALLPGNVLQRDQPIELRPCPRHHRSPYIQIPLRPFSFSVHQNWTLVSLETVFNPVSDGFGPSSHRCGHESMRWLDVLFSVLRTGVRELLSDPCRVPPWPSPGSPCSATSPGKLALESSSSPMSFLLCSEIDSLGAFLHCIQRNEFFPQFFVPHPNFTKWSSWSETDSSCRTRPSGPLGCSTTGTWSSACGMIKEDGFLLA
jgi:hypothetical protein